MLTEEEEKFLVFWEKNRERERSIGRQLSLGLPLGLIISAGILLNFVSGWYTRATMVANSQSTPAVLILAVIIITLFCSIFFKRHQWDMREQRYLELMYKKKTPDSDAAMQQDGPVNSH